MNYRNRLRRMYRQARPCWWVLGAMLALFILVSAGRLAFGDILYFNSTRSAPIGWYVICPGGLSRGDYATVHLTQDVPALHSEKGRLLLKRAMGFPGDTYTVTESSLTLDGTVYPVSRAGYLPHLAPGTYTVPDGCILFLNPPVISFDSRYLGPVPETEVVRKVTLLIPAEELLNGVEAVFPIVKALGDDEHEPTS